MEQSLPFDTVVRIVGRNVFLQHSGKEALPYRNCCQKKNLDHQSTWSHTLKYRFAPSLEEINKSKRSANRDNKINKAPSHVVYQNTVEKTH